MMKHTFYAVGMMALILFLAACDHMQDMGKTLGLNTEQQPQPSTVTIVHINDLHSQLDPLHPPEEPSQGGVARIKTLIDNIRAEKGEQNVLLLNGGDNFQGTMYYNTWKGSAEVMVLNHLRFDAITLGNHEFDSGPLELARALKGEPVTIAGIERETEAARFITVASNIDTTGEPELDSQLVKRAIVHKGGQTYGLIGVTTETTKNVSSPGENVHFLDYLASVEQQVAALEAEGVNKIIVMSHSGSDEDRKRIPHMSGVDIIIAGHDHALFGDKEEIVAMGLPKQAERVVSEYPTVVKDKDGNNVVLVSAMEKGRWLGNLDITFDADGTIPDGGWKANQIFVHGCIYAEDEFGNEKLPDCSKQAAEPHPEFAKVVDHYRKPMEEVANEIVGEAMVDFMGRHAAGADNLHSMGDLTADIMLANTKAQYQTVAAVMNRGGMRADLPKGELRYSDIASVLPFDNTVAVVELSGDELLEAMDVAISEAGGKSYGAYPHVAGMHIRYCSEPVCDDALLTGGRIEELKVQGQDVQANGRYRIVSNDYLTNGGDFYTMFEIACKREGGYCMNTGMFLRDMVVDWFRDHSPIGPVESGRVVMTD